MAAKKNEWEIEHISTSMYGVDFTDEQCKVMFKLIEEAEQEKAKKIIDDLKQTTLNKYTIKLLKQKHIESENEVPFNTHKKYEK